jgi:hypothetical protein
MPFLGKRGLRNDKMLKDLQVCIREEQLADCALRQFLHSCSLRKYGVWYPMLVLSTLFQSISHGTQCRRYPHIREINQQSHEPVVSRYSVSHRLGSTSITGNSAGI